jgi:hypothetical protein
MPQENGIFFDDEKKKVEKRFQKLDQGSTGVPERLAFPP